MNRHFKFATIFFKVESQYRFQLCNKTCYCREKNERKYCSQRGFLSLAEVRLRFTSKKERFVCTRTSCSKDYSLFI